MKEFRLAYEQSFWIPGHGYKVTRHFQTIFAKDMDHALGKWGVMQLENQSLICLTEQ